MAAQSPRWMSYTLALAGCYNLAWGAWVVFFPTVSFAYSGVARAEPLAYPELWQCIGMIVGVYGIGYWVAAADPIRHWPIVLVGLLGKIFGPIGWVHGALQGQLAWTTGWTCLTNDLIWWVPFALIIRRAYIASRDEENRPAPRPLSESLKIAVTSSGRTLAELSREGPTLVLFVRHVGCTFCREALADLGRLRERFRKEGITPVVVHMSSPAVFERLLPSYSLEGIDHISDPTCELYRSFGLRRGTLGQLFNVSAVRRFFSAGIRDGHGVGLLDGDGRRLGGVFLLRDEAIVRAVRLNSTAERPDYCSTAGCAAVAEPAGVS